MRDCKRIETLGKNWEYDVQLFSAIRALIILFADFPALIILLADYPFTIVRHQSLTSKGGNNVILRQVLENNSQ
jgi:hypothetical protein